MTREQDKRIAEMMGWTEIFEVPAESALMGRAPGLTKSLNDLTRQEINVYYSVIPEYTTDPSADYEVLKFIRGTARKVEGGLLISSYKFCEALSEIMRNRGQEIMGFWPPRDFFYYEPGDYSKAAIKALDNDR
ncbi:MAG: hypothetical protein MJA83_10320 [Gammaproteobacteria bacterium]|nr:hypothetical protein [Gammaproteobacteria bacterium]